MEWPDELKSKTDAEAEAWFLDGLSRPDLPRDAMFRALQHLHESGRAPQAEEWANLMQEAMAGDGDAGGALALVELRRSWNADAPAFRAACRDALAAAIKPRLDRACLDAAFDGERPLGECLRRFRLLLRLRPGALCLDKTWGFGVVGHADEFYRKLTVDFDRKPRHVMSMAYAAETLDVLAEDHLLAVRHRRPQEFAERVRTDAASVVRLALSSYGPLSAQRLKDVLAEHAIVDEERWKPFWDAARVALKADPLIDVPARRNEPLRLLDKAKAYDDAWFDALKAERDPGVILRLVGEVAGENGGEVDSAHRAALAERLAYVARDAGGRRPEGLARALLLARRLGLAEPGAAGGSTLDAAAMVNVLAAPEPMLGAVSVLGIRDTEELLKLLAERAPVPTLDRMLELFDRFPTTAMTPAAGLLAAAGREAALAERLRSFVASRQAPGELLLWLARQPTFLAEQRVASIPEILGQVLDALERPLSGDRLRTRNQLRGLFEHRPWLDDILGRLDRVQRETFFRRIQASRGMDTLLSRSVMARMVKLYPELEQIAASGQRQPESSARPGTGLFTSWRSFNQRQEQYRCLMEQEIPRNSREIAVARSYGDLRENAEYKAAKEHQGILMRRQAEMEQDLRDVQPTDFAGLPADAAGVGTCVRLRRPDGRPERYCILGEWDRDPALGIIASRSNLAKQLSGRRVGDRVCLPGDGADQLSTIESVDPLYEDIRAWMAQAAPDPGGAA